MRWVEDFKRRKAKDRYLSLRRIWSPNGDISFLGQRDDLDEAIQEILDEAEEYEIIEEVEGSGSK